MKNPITIRAIRAAMPGATPRPILPPWERPEDGVGIGVVVVVASGEVNDYVEDIRGELAVIETVAVVPSTLDLSTLKIRSNGANIR
jgi:hypothetical protein